MVDRDECLQQLIVLSALANEHAALVSCPPETARHWADVAREWGKLAEEVGEHPDPIDHPKAQEFLALIRAAIQQTEANIAAAKARLGAG